MLLRHSVIAKDMQFYRDFAILQSKLVARAIDNLSAKQTADYHLKLRLATYFFEAGQCVAENQKEFGILMKDFGGLLKIIFFKSFGVIENGKKSLLNF